MSLDKGRHFLTSDNQNDTVSLVAPALKSLADTKTNRAYNHGCLAYHDALRYTLANVMKLSQFGHISVTRHA